MHMEVKNQQGDLKIYGTDENEISIYIDLKNRYYIPIEEFAES